MKLTRIQIYSILPCKCIFFFSLLHIAILILSFYASLVHISSPVLTKRFDGPGCALVLNHSKVWSDILISSQDKGLAAFSPCGLKI